MPVSLPVLLAAAYCSILTAHVYAVGHGNGIYTAKAYATVYITGKGKKFNTETCRFTKKSSKPMKGSAAVKKGYKLCKMCNP